MTEPTVTTSVLATELARLAQALEPLNGEGRSAAVWALGERPELLYAGRHVRPHILEVATDRLARGDSSFEVDSEPGVRGKVVVCGDGAAAYGLFLHGAGRPHLTRTLDELITAAERGIGKPVDTMTRAEKQRLVRFLDERGAFHLRRAVDQVADRLGVTRFTIYNYLGKPG